MDDLGFEGDYNLDNENDSNEEMNDELIEGIFFFLTIFIKYFISLFLAYQLQTDNYENDGNEIGQEDTWVVISAYFKTKGLVRQQLDSFNSFINDTIQEIVDDSGEIEIKPRTHRGNQGEMVTHHVKFKQTYLSKPDTREEEGRSEILYPNAARLRGLTYSSPLRIDIDTMTHRVKDDKYEPREATQKCFFGRIPIMVRSQYCQLSECEDKDLTAFKECPYDQGKKKHFYIINHILEQQILSPK